MPMALERSTSVFGTDTCGPTSYHFNVANERLGCTPVHLPTQLDVVEENTLRSQPGCKFFSLLLSAYTGIDKIV
jgi:hypothetical protein